MTGLVDRAERRGVVARVRDRRDRRAACIELTEQGEEIAYAAHRKITEHVEKLVVDIAPDDRERLEHLAWTIVGTPAPRS
ncbi:hypothetical protein AB0K12_29005 [Nonomuraea sp. NPDC049419]|uniref:hypothetical protein n=1 Tax=Nonomuraea sp. NPDC049419 TaxID=3155772 RepID=UPI00342B58AE